MRTMMFDDFRTMLASAARVFSFEHPAYEPDAYFFPELHMTFPSSRNLGLCASLCPMPSLLFLLWSSKPSFIVNHKASGFITILCPPIEKYTGFFFIQNDFLKVCFFPCICQPLLFVFSACLGCCGVNVPYLSYKTLYRGLLVIVSDDYNFTKARPVFRSEFDSSSMVNRSFVWIGSAASFERSTRPDSLSQPKR